jgi:hypothetical protein
MRRFVVIAVILSLAVIALGTVQAAGDVQEEAKKDAKKAEAEKKEAPKHQYVGVSKCAMCHKAKARGNQVAAWENARHSKAYETLGTDKAKEIAKKMEIDDPQKSPKCLKCHVTAYGVDKELLGPKYTMEEGVGCESCHGPGGDYMKLSIMKDREKSVAAGLVVPTEELCVSCHNEESPTYVKFVYKEKVAKIAHPRPKAEE